jgi:hypothetical protein
MSKAEKFIEDCTRKCSNEQIVCGSNRVDRIYSPWLSPDQARRAVEIAREEMIERACDTYCKVCGHYPHKTPKHICRQACDYYKDFRKSMKDET